MANKSNAIIWFNDEKEAFSVAKEQQKALMMMFHREWCGACKKLWPKVNNDPQIQEISAQFVMLDLRNENDKTGVKYAPDGEYVPRLEIQFHFIYGKTLTILCVYLFSNDRIIFADPDGNTLMHIQNESNFSGINQFSYKEPSEIISSMKKALASIKK